MNIAQQCKLLYRNGAKYVEQWPDGGSPFPRETSDLLKEHGLPVSFDILGIHFLDQARPISEQFWQIGYEWEKENPIYMEIGTGYIYTVEGKKTRLINTSIKTFLLFLEYFGSYSQRQPKVTPSSFSFQQMQEKLARIKNREIETRQSPGPRQSPAKEAKKMKVHFQKLDPDAIGKKHWWPTIIEQVKDGIL